MVHWLVELRRWISSRPQAVGQSVARRWGWLHRSGWALLGKTSREDKARPENIFFFLVQSSVLELLLLLIRTVFSE